MKKLLLTFVTSVFCFYVATAQNAIHPNIQHSGFPQQKINALAHSFDKQAETSGNVVRPEKNGSAYQSINKMNEVRNTDWDKYAHGSYNVNRVMDTIYVGLVPNDTLWITGTTFNHNGPIFIFNDGVLIFYNATATNYGDIIVFQHGTVLGVGSNLTFPQSYFYQRSLIAVQNSTVYLNSCNLNYSGIQHNLVIGDSAQVGLENVHQADWTTAGLFGKGSIWIHGMNLGGEYILTDTSTSYFSNVDSLLLWHKLPNTAVVNYAFPAGASVMGYQFNNTVPGVSGIGYQTYADSCHTVWWGLMPTNGSDVTISNSDIRAIGTWFEHGDSAAVTGVFDNTLYANTVMPLSDRNLHMISTNVMTWSLYVFDSSEISIDNCTVGEVGTQQRANIISQNFLLDGSGGYFWATDTSAIFASGVTVYSTARSERYGTFVLSYSYLPFSVPTSIHNSLFISVQNILPADPLPYDASVMWLENIESPSTAHADSLIQVKGSAWIDQGPMGNFLDYGSYSLYYQLQGASAWTAIVVDSAMEIRHNTLGVWNTNGLIAGTYILRLVVKDIYADSVEDFKAVTILPAVPTGLNKNENNLMAAVFPNPAVTQLTLVLSENNSTAEIKIYNLLGETKMATTTKSIQTNIDLAGLAPGVYIIETSTGNKINRQRFIKK